MTETASGTEADAEAGTESGTDAGTDTASGHATPPIWPWFVHKRMLPKWSALLATGAVAVWAPAGPAWPLLVGAGFLLFFPLEYGVHRGVYHFLADKPPGKVLSVQHIKHHQDPEDVDHLFNHPAFSVGIGAALFAAYWAVTGALGDAAAVSMGNYGGLLYYEWVHFQSHRPGVKPWTPWGRWVKKLHLLHHYKNEHYWFGVTSPTFDFAFGSFRDQREVDPSETVSTLLPPDDVAELLKEE